LIWYKAIDFVMFAIILAIPVLQWRIFFQVPHSSLFPVL
jgi:hypothetical protein